MSNLYIDIFDDQRKQIWGKLSFFKDIGILGGGTALALQLKHRISFDFDIFSRKSITKNLLNKVKGIFSLQQITPLVDSSDELTLEIDNVKITFLYYPFTKLFDTVKTDSIDIFSVNDIAADKAYTVGRRGAWRDYYDVFSLIKKGVVSLNELISLAKKKYGTLFNEKLFLEQLTYFEDIKDFSVEVKDGVAFPVHDVQNYLSLEVKEYLSKTLPISSS